MSSTNRSFPCCGVEQEFTRWFYPGDTSWWIQGELTGADRSNPGERLGKETIQDARGSLIMPRGKICCMCKGSTVAALIKCPLSCPQKLCSADCYLAHRRSCTHASLDRLKVLILSQQKEKSLVVALLGNGISVDLEVPGRRRTPDASLVMALNRGGIKEALQQLDALQSQRIEGRLAVPNQERSLA